MTAPAFDSRGELAQVARRTRSRLREQILFVQSADKPFDQECRFTLDGRPVTWRTNGRLFMIAVTAASGVVFAAGRPDQIIGASQPGGAAAGVPIFVKPEFLPTPWLSQPEHLALVAALGLGANEQLLVAGNVTNLIVEPRGIEADWKRLGDLLLLVAALPPDDPPPGKGELIDGLRFDAAEVTAELRQLLPLLRTWAIGDDTARSDRIEIARDADLRELVAVVAGERHRVDALFDLHDEPVPDEAILLGRLAEAAAEAERELERRVSGSWTG